MVSHLFLATLMCVVWHFPHVTFEITAHGAMRNAPHVCKIVTGQYCKTVQSSFQLVGTADITNVAITITCSAIDIMTKVLAVP